jgi:RNA polymerase sigma factor (sigma-70 family)
MAVTWPPRPEAVPGTERASVDRVALAERALAVAFRAALGVLGDRDAAEDVAQDVALEALRRGHTIREPERLDGWLFRVAVRTALRQARRDSDRRERERRADRLEAPGADDLAAALELLHGLPPRQRAALTLRYVFDLPDEAIARALGCRRGTVRTLLFRGRAAVRERLDREDSR